MSLIFIYFYEGFKSRPEPGEKIQRPRNPYKFGALFLEMLQPFPQRILLLVFDAKDNRVNQISDVVLHQWKRIKRLILIVHDFVSYSLKMAILINI